MAIGPTPRPAGLDRGTMIFIGFLAVLFFFMIGLYFAQLKESIATVRATRPVLVFTLIVAMLGFGGMLMFRSLFGTEAHTDFEPRFRLAREVFLVYAGIFGTIIGFYFGAADTDPDIAPLSATLSTEQSELSADIAGGTPPFLVYLQRRNPPLDVVFDKKDGDRSLVAKFPPDACPINGTVFVVDSAGKRTSTEIRPQGLVSWPNCADELAELAGQSAAGNTQNGLGAVNATDDGNPTAAQ